MLLIWNATEWLKRTVCQFWCYRFETKRETYQALIPMAWVKSINSRQGNVTAIPYFKDGKKLNFKSSSLKLKSFRTWLKLINETSTFNAHMLCQKSEQGLHKFFKEISLKAKYYNFIHIFELFKVLSEDLCWKMELII